MKKRSLGWPAPVLLLLTFFIASARAQTPPPAGGMSLSVAPAQRAPWQEHLTLGPGDTLDFAMYINDNFDQPRNDVVIGPDGLVTYLEARDIMASGLTIEELRAKMDAELGKYYRSPKTVITPVGIHSKKYYVLGSVVNKGVYAFDRPLTIIEAIGRAGGLETGVFERNTVEMADLSRSFVVRHGQKLPVDFEKLYQQGDLSQNIPLEPDDYLYFASSGANEIYVLGQVLSPGTTAYTPGIGAIGAIASRGGFAIKAYKSRVLIVRGSLSHPQTFEVNTHEALDGKAPDFRLQPRDIVYVSPRPWARAEQLLDDSTRAFIEALVVTYTGAKVGPFINPIVH